jgi:voltage-gated potassium channel
MIEDLFQVAKRLKYAGGVFIFILILGTVGFKIIGGEEASILDALYMSAITISTVGFHEVIDLETHPYGRLFTIFFTFAGFGVLTYFLSNLVALFIEGDLRKTFIKRKMQKKIEKMDGHYIICGVGRVGKNIAEELIQTERPFVLADLNETLLEEFVRELEVEVPYAVGDCTDEDFLTMLGADRSRGIFVTAGDDNTNLVICLTARQLNPAMKIVVRSTDVAHSRKLRRAGANKVVSPNYIGGLRMASEMIRPAVTNFLDDMIKSNINQRLEEFIVPESLAGKKVADIPLQDLEQTIVLAVSEEDRWHYNPPKSMELKQGMHIVIMTSTKDRKTLESRIA